MHSDRGAYTADRAAALSGVPQSTVHDWARKEVLVPSVSAERLKLWSFADLMGLRIIYWLRHPKEDADGGAVPGSSMQAVRNALQQLAELDLDLWNEAAGPRVSVDRGGDVNVLHGDQTEAGYRQRRLAAADELDVIAPFKVIEGGRGPNLYMPRPHLRIVPGKLGGAPHVADTRLESEALASLVERGLPTAKIYRLYPDVARESIDEALDLEAQLRHNLQPLAA